MEWEDKPKESGWYWWKSDKYWPRIVLIENGSIRECHGDGMSLAMGANPKVFEGVKFAGPILPPKS